MVVERRSILTMDGKSSFWSRKCKRDRPVSPDQKFEKNDKRRTFKGKELLDLRSGKIPRESKRRKNPGVEENRGSREGDLSFRRFWEKKARESERNRSSLGRNVSKKRISKVRGLKSRGIKVSLRRGAYPKRSFRGRDLLVGRGFLTRKKTG